jgi:hypothetical protein
MFMGIEEERTIAAPTPEVVEKLNRIVMRNVEGARVRLIDQMAHDLYNALHKRQQCTACNGSGLTYHKCDNPEDDPDLEDVILSDPCGCVKHTNRILRRYRDEYVLLSDLSQSEGFLVSEAGRAKNGVDGL